MRVCTGCARTTDEAGRFCPACGAANVDESSAATAPAGIPTASRSDLVGLTIDGQFRIDAALGGGAFGTVYRGSQLGLERPVAVKVPTFEIASDPVMARRFAREARSAARVHHPGVVQIYAVGELSDGRPYLAMQFVDGQPLDHILADGPLPAPRALRIARAIASALAETHAADVVHRDLKPSNIIWRQDRHGDDRITLVDFGIAVCKPGNADATRLTTGGGLVGTPHYMSPEQAHGEQVDARADLYALGCVLFELVTGTPPYDGSGVEVLLAHLGRPAPVPSARYPDVPELIDELCGALLAKAPDDRPPTADALVAMLDEGLDELEGRRPSASTRTRSPRPKRPTLATRRDLPPGVSAPRSRGARRAWLGVGAGAVALAAAGFAITLSRDPHVNQALGGAAEEPDDLPNGPVDPHGKNRREIFKDDGELVIRALVPDPILAGREIRPHLAIKNKLGQPIVASEIVLTIGDGNNAKGLTALPHGGPERGHYDFRYTFAHPGTYVLRVFPPSVDSAFEIPLDVR